ncbi:MAG: hypothetical protein LBB21_02755, partial [Holosporaceae bacterium]|nr:hypothetical protein [Holosporaceae bacterium]
REFGEENWSTDNGQRFSKKKLRKILPEVRKQMIDMQEKISVRHQCELLSLCRSGLFYEAKSEETTQRTA